MGMLRHILHRLAHIVKRQSLVAADVQHQALRPVQLALDQRAFNGALHRLDDAPCRAFANAQQRVAGMTLPENGDHVGKIHIDDARRQNDFRNAKDRLAQNVVRRLERIHQCHPPVIGQLHQIVVVNDEQRVQSIPKGLNALVCRPHLALSFKGKRHRHHADGKHAELLHKPCNDRRCARSDAAAHARRDEHEIGVPKRHLQPRKVALRRLRADLGNAAGAAPPGHALPDLHYLYACFLQNRELLRIGIHSNQFYAGNLVLRKPQKHAVSAAAYADDLDPHNGLGDPRRQSLHRVKRLPHGTPQ